MARGKFGEITGGEIYEVLLTYVRYIAQNNVKTKIIKIV